MSNKTIHRALRRDLGMLGATMIGLGSILGTGVFVSIGFAAGVTGPSVIFAILLAALVATCNALSSAQLAASYPVSGGTYEYGYRYLHPALGFIAGWMFLCAKTASAATAALGFAGYFLHLFGFQAVSIIPVAITSVIVLTLIVLSGLKRSNRINLIIVSITLFSLVIFVIAGFPGVLKNGSQNLTPFFPKTTNGDFRQLLYATALMFVAYTGYGRIATMGEEVKTPATTIPRAIILVLVVSAVIYILVAVVALGSVGSNQLAIVTQNQATPLEVAASRMSQPGLVTLIAIGACTAMLSVLLNLILGLSRMTLAMGRRHDLPEIFTVVSQKHRTPVAAVVGIGLIICGLTLFGSVETTWAFSAFTVLIYYSITNLAALNLAKEERLYPNFIAIIGLISCLFLAFWVPLTIWLSGLLLITLGLIYRTIIIRQCADKSVRFNKLIPTPNFIMDTHQLTITFLKKYKQIELNNENNLQFFRDKHSTKEGTWGNLTVHDGTIEFVFLDGHAKELSRLTLTPKSEALLIPPASWHKIASTSPEFEATLQFYCLPHRYFEKKYHLTSIHHDLWYIYQTYLQEREKMTILDIGCGSGRNPLYFALSGHDIIALDKNEDAITNIQHIAAQEQLLNIEALVHDLNKPLPFNDKLFDFIYSTVALQFLNPSSIKPLLNTLQTLTSPGGFHFLVFPIKAESYTYPERFTYLAEVNELYHFYQDSGWSILEYKEKPGQLHKLDEQGKPKPGIFGHLLAQKHG